MLLKLGVFILAEILVSFLPLLLTININNGDCSLTEEEHRIIMATDDRWLMCDSECLWRLSSNSIISNSDRYVNASNRIT